MMALCESCQDEKQLSEFNRDKWKANIKFDGVRCLAIKKDGEVILVSRGNNILSYKFREVVKALLLLNGNFIIDGEIVNMDNSVGGNFTLLSKRVHTKDRNKLLALEKTIPVKLMVFDILSLNDKFLKNEMLKDRLVFLNELLKENTDEHLEKVVYDDIDVLLKEAKERKGEGIVIKNMEGIYESKRSKNWYKYKLFKETTITITGFTENNAGIRVTDDDDNAIQISGRQSDEVKQILESVGYATINIQYFTQSKEGKYRFPSYRGIVENE
jgi:ATP-dependent DNA ligase